VLAVYKAFGNCTKHHSCFPLHADFTFLILS
jgi:hypothetical protein